MKRALILVALVCAACDVGDGTTGARTKAIGKCKDKKGDVRSHPSSIATWSPLGAGSELAEGDWIQTAADAFARIEFFSGSMLEIEPSSVVVLEEEESGEAKEHMVGLVALRSGRVHGVVGDESAKPKEIVVRTQSGKAVRIAPVSGSGELDYRVAAQDNGDLELAVSKGKATVKGADGASVTLAKGEAQAVKGGQLSGGVIALPSAPQTLGVARTAIISASRPVELHWKEEPRAKYRIQIADDDSFDRVLVDQVVTLPTFSFKPPKGGPYAWRVSAKDERGQESDFSNAEKLVALDAIADQLVGPPDGAAITYQTAAPSIAFGWRPEPGSKKERYEIVIVRGTDLSGEVAIKQALDAPAFATKKLGPGEYRWMVYRLIDGERRPISPEPRRLVVKRSASGIQLPKKLKWE